MNIAIIGATGKAGKRIMQEFLSRHEQVTAIVRDSKKLAQDQAHVAIIEKGIFELVYDDVSAIDVIINAFGTWSPETLPLHKKVALHLTQLLDGKRQKLVIVGGAGSLFVNQDKLPLSQSDGFPESYKPVAEAMADALAVYRQATNVNWLYLSPAADFIADGPRTGNYVLAGEAFSTNLQGESKISYADYALALADVVESGKYNKQRISVRW